MSTGSSKVMALVFTEKSEIEVITIDDDDEELDPQLSDKSEDSAIGLYANPQYHQLSIFNKNEPLLISAAEITADSTTSDKTDHELTTISQRTIRLTDTQSSIISSSVVRSSSLSLPNNITSDNVINKMKKFSDNSKFENVHKNSRTSTVDIADQGWTHKTNPVMPSFCTKPLSSPSTSSGCSSDIELVSSPETDHHESPDSPDSGVSGSVNSADDLKHTDEDEDVSSHSTTNHQTHGSSYIDFNNLFRMGSSNHHQSKATNLYLHDESNSFDNDSISAIIAHESTTAKSANALNTEKSQFSCKWLECDWPGNYEELAEHVREIHVELQPFLDSHGKVIKWSQRKYQNRNSNYEAEEFSNSECDEEHSEEEEEEVVSEDDSQSIASTSTCRLTRRSNRAQGLFDYSQNSNSYKLRQNSRFHDHRESHSEQQFVCLWAGCKVFGKPSSSRQWLERHVLELHSGPKPFKCIVDGCGQRFKSQISLQRHVNTHFRGTSMSNMTVVNGMNSSNSGDHLTNCCCNCFCHSCFLCDTSSSQAGSCNGSTTNDMRDGSIHTKTLPPSSDKDRCESVDSAISLNSSDSLPSSASSTSSHTSAAQPSLSKHPFHVPFSGNEHCHSPCCCILQPKSELTSISALVKQLKGSRKSSSHSNKQTYKNFDNFDEHTANILVYRVAARMSKLTTSGQFGAQDSCLQTKRGPSRKLVAPSERAFVIEETFTFYSEVESWHTREDGESIITLKWLPEGIIPNTCINAKHLEANRHKQISVKKLPESFQKFLKSKRSHCFDSNDSPRPVKHHKSW